MDLDEAIRVIDKALNTDVSAAAVDVAVEVLEMSGILPMLRADLQEYVYDYQWDRDQQMNQDNTDD